MPPPPFLFVVGCGRSGTTLLRAMLNAHPDMAVPSESYFIIPMDFQRSHRYELPGGFDHEAFLSDLVEHPALRSWGISEDAVRSAIASAVPHSLSEAIRRVYALYAHINHKPRYGDKTATYVLRLPTLARLFPESRFLHLIRDGRDVALSWLDVQWGMETIEELALYWSNMVQAGRAAGSWLGGTRYLEVRYEHLVVEPEAALSSICNFAGLTWSDSMLRYYRDPSPVLASVRFPAAHGHLSSPPTSGLRQWKRDLAPRDVAAFDALAGPVLAELGYNEE